MLLQSCFGNDCSGDGTDTGKVATVCGVGTSMVDIGSLAVESVILRSGLNQVNDRLKT